MIKVKKLLIITLIISFICLSSACRPVYVGIERNGERSIIYNGVIYNEAPLHSDYMPADLTNTEVKIGEMIESYFIGRRIPFYYLSTDEQINIIYGWGGMPFIKEGYNYPDPFTVKLSKIIYGEGDVIDLPDKDVSLTDMIESTDGQYYDVKGYYLDFHLKEETYIYLDIRLKQYNGELYLSLSLGSSKSTSFKINEEYADMFLNIYETIKDN